MTHDEYQQLVEFLGRQFEAIDRRFETIDRRFDRVEVKLADHDENLQALRRIENLLAHEKGRCELLERGLEELKLHVSTLQPRIEELEQRLRA